MKLKKGKVFQSHGSIEWEESYEFVKKMMLEPEAGIWAALLDACAVHRDVKLGQKVADFLVETAPDIGAYQVRTTV